MAGPYRTPAVIAPSPRGQRWATEWQKVWVLLMRRLPHTQERMRWERIQARRGRLLATFASATWVQVLLAEMRKAEARNGRPFNRPVDS